MRASRLTFLLTLLGWILASLTACATMQRWASRNESERHAARVQEVQLKVMRYADGYSSQIKDPLETLKSQSTTAEERLAAHDWRIEQATAAYTIASGSNPLVNALDMIVLATLSRMVVEDERTGAFSGIDVAPLLEAHRSLERQSWALVEGMLDSEQTNQLRALIEQWRARHPATQAVSQVRLADFSAIVGRASSTAHEGASLFALIGLDPLRNLDPAVRELEQTRQLAERTIYYLQRAPSLLDMQIERLAYQLTVMPESKQTLAVMERVGGAAEALGELTADTPAIIASERHALIVELSAVLHAEQDRMRALLIEVRSVLNAGAQTSESVGATVAALDAFVARFRPPDIQRTENNSLATPRRPFDITEYAQTASELASAAQGVQALLVQLDASSASFERMAGMTQQSLREIVDRAFWRGIALIVALAGTALIAMLTYRYAITRWLGSPSTSASLGVLLAIAASIACARAVAEQATTTARPEWPNVVLTPSASPTDPATAMGGMHLVEELDGHEAVPSQAQHGNWVVAPIPFRNELLGAGLVLGAGYLYGASATDRDARHSVAAAAAMYAEGGSWAGLAAHRGYWSEQRYRTTGALATGELLYDVELQLGDNHRTLAVAQQFAGVTLEAATRIGASGWLGFGYRGGHTDVLIRYPTDALPAEFTPATPIESSNLLLNGELDTRDSDLYPSSGHYAQAEALIARQELGSDHDYLGLELEWNAYRRIRDSHVLAWRIAGKLVDGDPPFFAMSWFGSGVDLRGYTPGRYIAESMFAAQLEWRWQVTPRWGLAAFGGAGKVWNALGDIDTDAWLPAGGVSARFRLAKALPLNLRADFAWGRDDSTFTLAIGEAF